VIHRLARWALLLTVVLARPAFAADHVIEPAAEPAATDRIFGVVPNYTTVEPMETVKPVTTRESFRLAALSSFDPFVYPTVGLMAGLNQGSSVSSYRVTYGRAMADNAVGNFMTTAVLPSVLHEDPRYFALGTGSILHRAAYALSRSVVTRTRAGHLTFNVSEIAGNAAAAGISNLYYGPADRTVAGTMSRWGSQVMWDTVGNELKEFWPDIRRKIHKR
jgi:hypothetical protein